MSDAAAARVAIPQRAQPATRDSRAKVMRAARDASLA